MMFKTHIDQNKAAYMHKVKGDTTKWDEVKLMKEYVENKHMRSYWQIRAHKAENELAECLEKKAENEKQASGAERSGRLSPAPQPTPKRRPWKT